MSRLSPNHDSLSEKENRDPIVDRLERLWTKDSLALKQGTSERLGQYQLLEVGGFGTFGVVYKALDHELGRLVALKVPRMETLFDPDKRERFAKEAEVAAKLSHSGIVPVYEAVLSGPTPFIASQWCEGPDLDTWLTQHSPPQPRPWRELVLMMAQIADAVAYAHQQGVYHRDLKPSNILLFPVDPKPENADPISDQPDRSDRQESEAAAFAIRITDFGLAKIADSLLETRASLVIGTPLYMAPEQLDRNSSSGPPEAVDIYSMGVILFHMLTGELPVSGESYVEVLDNLRHSSPRRLIHARPELSKAIDTVCAKCLEREPHDRYESAQALAIDLRNCAADRPILGKRPTFLSRLSAWCLKPARIDNAGWFAIVSHTLLSLWLIGSVMLAAFKFEMSSEQWEGQFQMVLSGVCFSTIPVIITGVAILHRIRIAVVFAVVISFVKIGFMSNAIIRDPIFYRSLYQDGRVFSFMDLISIWCVLLILFCLSCCALAADRTHDICESPIAALWARFRSQ